MAEVTSSPNITEDERPIAARRKRRTGTNSSSHSQSNSEVAVRQPQGISTPPATPKRSKKRVRFSDPGPDTQSEPASSGLTPFICRTSLGSPLSKRRNSTPANFWNLAGRDEPLSGTLNFKPLRQVLEGRAMRRLTRRGLSEEINRIEWDKRQEVKAKKTEMERLRSQLEERNLEIQQMKAEQEILNQMENESETSVDTSTKIQELEQQLLELKAKLQQKEAGAMEDPNWTMAAKDPFEYNDYDDVNEDVMITNYDQDFRESMMNDELLTTPTRLNTSFPSPPSTMPNTPCKSASAISPRIEASAPIPDPENELLKTQLDSLQSEVSKLTAAIAFKDDNQSRLGEKLYNFLPLDESHDHSTLDSALDAVLTQLALSQSHALERENAFSALSTEITNLGFPAAGPEEALETIGHQFRKARLDLEYLTPGEVVEGLENAKLLSMLLSRIEVLLERVKERDGTIDQYHEQEVSLRQQLNTRVDALQDVQKELYLANSVVMDLRTEIEEKEIGNERLQKALEGYRQEVKGLEDLIVRVEKDGRENEEVLKGEVREIEERLQDEILKHDTTRALDEGKDIMIVELERRLNAALQAIAEVEKQMAELATAYEVAVAEKAATAEQLKSSANEREKSHGAALALRDARVSELRGEVERVNEALKTAHSRILLLRKENNELDAQVEGEKTRGKFVMQAMRQHMNRALETSLGYINGDVSVQGPRREGSAPPAVGESFNPQSVVRRGRFLDGDVARRGGKKRRRYDSGLGFLEEGDEGEILTEIDA